MVDRFKDGLLTSTETASYLQIPQSTLTSWLKGRAAGAPLVHQVEPLRKGQPSVPFIAAAEAHVLPESRSPRRRVAEGLRACGWSVHRIGDVIPDDGQDVAERGLDRSRSRPVVDPALEGRADQDAGPGDPACPGP
ncbi:hypothetical protein [Streptomyces sp. NPDC050121]|uniref:hypothetical protein n=1 Tax=Streptomyces sp. NPDC050121 TaxID=3365601 RepID=UPI00379EEA1F